MKIQRVAVEVPGVFSEQNDTGGRMYRVFLTASIGAPNRELMFVGLDSFHRRASLRIRKAVYTVVQKQGRLYA